MGIMLQEFSTNNEIIGNDIKSNSRFGLYLQHGSVNNNITCNNFINNGYEKSYRLRGNAFFIDSEFVPYSNKWKENY